MSWGRTKAVVSATVMVAAAAAVVAPSGRSAPVSATFEPVADAYTSSDRPTSNFGTSTLLRVDASPISFAPSWCSRLAERTLGESRRSVGCRLVVRLV
jgi:hypothetical protein